MKPAGESRISQERERARDLLNVAGRALTDAASGAGGAATCFPEMGRPKFTVP